MEFAAGDVLVFPRGNPYAMLSSPDERPAMNPEDTLGFFRAMATGELPFVVTEGGGGSERAQFVCGFLGCDAHPFNPLLATLPELMHLRRPVGAQAICWTLDRAHACGGGCPESAVNALAAL
jgi:hypothetical protein